MPTDLRRTRHEILLVLGVSLGQSAVYAVLSLVQSALSTTGVAGQSAPIHTSLDSHPWMDLLLQITGIGFGLVPFALALWLLSEPGRSGAARIGLDLHRIGRDSRTGIGLAALIGIPGLVLYAVSRLIGINANVEPSTLGAHWWVVPVLLLQAAQAALVEEGIVTGYLMTRLRSLGWRPARVLLASAALRGCYHLYQGVGAGLGNFVMGLVFGAWFQRKHRVLPLMIAHFIIDALVFVGYALLHPWLASQFPAIF